MDTKNINPSTYLGFGTWILWGSGKVPVGVDTSDTDFNTVEKTGGNKTVTLATSQIPSHSHTLNNHTHSFSATTGSSGSHSHTFNARSGSVASGTAQNGLGTTANHNATWDTNSTGAHTHSVSGTTGGNSGNTSSVGGGESHNNIQPYITCYMWKRTS